LISGRRPAPPEDSGGILQFKASGDADRAGGLDLDEVNHRLAQAVRPATLVVSRSRV